MQYGECLEKLEVSFHLISPQTSFLMILDDRHGPECFNYSFPQELDDKFLVISDTLEGKVPVSK